MAEPISIQQLKDASLDVKSLEEVVNGDENVVVTTRLGETYPSVKGSIKTLFENGGLPATPFATKALMLESELVDGDYAIVTNDVILENNGVYQKNNSAWNLIQWNPLEQSKAYVNDRFLEKNISIKEGVLFAVVDNDNNNTWLQASDVDGGLTSDAELAVRTKLGLIYKETSDFFAVVDDDGNYTDLRLDSMGRIHETVLDKWRERLGVTDPDTPKHTVSPISNLNHVLPILSATNTTVNSNDTYFKDGELLPVLPDSNKFIIIGSSSAERSAVAITAALKAIKPSITTYAPASGAMIADQQSALIGNVPIKLKFTGNKINKTGASTFTVASNYIIRGKTIGATGWVNGVLGTITNAGTFTRTAPSSTDTLLNGVTDFIPEKGNEYRNAMQIIWIGKNNLTSNNVQTNNVDALMAATDSMINYNASLIKRSVIMTHYNDMNTAAISAARDRINLCNHLYKLRYKQSVFDVEEIVLGTQVFTDLGIIRTAEDIAQQALGNMPPSLSSDAQHLKPQVYTYIAQKLADFINSKGFLGA